MSIQKLRQLVASKSCAAPRAVDTVTLPGSVLNRQQADRFIDLVVDETKFLQMIRRERVDHPRGEIIRLDLCEPVTEAACATSGTETTIPTESFIQYNLEKYRSSFIIKQDFLEDNIEGNRARDTMLNMFAKRMAMDLEYAAIMGDQSLSMGDGQPKVNNLLGANDGVWKILTECVPSCQIIDAQGHSVSKYLFHHALTRIPTKYRARQSEYRFLSAMSSADKLRLDLSDRETVLGDGALTNGNSFNPWGVPVVPVPLFPEDISIDITGGSEAPDMRSEGSFIILARPSNFVHLIQREIQQETERIAKFDCWQYFWHLKWDVVVENPDEVVIIKNIRNCGPDYCQELCPARCADPCGNPYSAD